MAASESPSMSPSESPSESPSASPTPSAPYSNANVLDDQLASLTGWTDIDIPAGVSTQELFDSRQCFKMSAPTTGDQARRQKDLGSSQLTGGKYVITIDTYFDKIATANNRAFMWLSGDDGTLWTLLVYWRTDTCTIASGTGAAPSYIEFETGATQDVWSLYTFDLNVTAGTVTIYKDGTLIANDITMWTDTSGGGGLDGRIILGQQCQNVADLITYYNYLQIGTDGVDTEQDPGDPSASQSASESPSISPSNEPGPDRQRSILTIYTFP